MTLSELLIVRSCLRRVKTFDRDVTWEKALDYTQREINIKTMDPRKDHLNPLYAADKVDFYKEVEVCLGCGKETSNRDCGCPAGTGTICKRIE